MVKKYSFILLVGMLFGVIESGYASIQPDSTRHLLARADSAFADNSYGTAFKYYKAALSSTRTQTDILPPVYLRLGQTCYYTGRYDEGIYYLYELLEKYTPDPLAKTEACILLGNLYLRLRQDSIALRHLHEAQTYLTEEAKMDDSVKMGQYCDLYICFLQYICKKATTNKPEPA